LQRIDAKRPPISKDFDFAVIEKQLVHLRHKCSYNLNALLFGLPNMFLSNILRCMKDEIDDKRGASTSFEESEALDFVAGSEILAAAAAWEARAGLRMEQMASLQALQEAVSSSAVGRGPGIDSNKGGTMPGATPTDRPAPLRVEDFLAEINRIRKAEQEVRARTRALSLTTGSLRPFFAHFGFDGRFVVDFVGGGGGVWWWWWWWWWWWYGGGVAVGLIAVGGGCLCLWIVQGDDSFG
jgi:hypothetical protein